MTPLLSVNVTVQHRGASQPVLRQVQLDIHPGETVGLLGRSGSGKSTLALAILGLLGKRAKATGSILYRGENLLGASESTLRPIRGRKIALVLQAASAALNPNLTIEAHFREAWLAHADGRWEDERDRVCDTLSALELDDPRGLLRRYPTQMSVGQAQRVLIGLANLHDPELILMDEPTSALDSFARAEVSKLVRRLNTSRKVAMLYISHDLGATAAVSQRIMILHEGEIVETGTPGQVFHAPRHPVTRGLVEASRDLQLEPVA